LLEEFLSKLRKADDVEREAAQIRFNHFEEGRQMKIRLLKKERASLVEAGYTSLPSPLAKHAKREIAGIIEMENKMAEIQKQNAAREAVEAKRKAEWEKEKKERRAALMAAKHERELAKKKAEDAEAVARRIRAKREAEKEKILLEEGRKEEKQRQIVRFKSRDI
ncbi:hypothetical protein DYB28_015780, partial [Aphanomyces astaci]